MWVNKEIFDKVFKIYCLITGIILIIVGLNTFCTILGIIMILYFLFSYPFKSKKETKSKETQESTNTYIELNKNKNDISNIKINYTDTPKEKTLAEKNFDIFSNVIKEYNLHAILDFEIVKTLHSYIEDCYYRYRLENNVKIDVNYLYNLFIDITHDELVELTTLEKLRNKHFGLAGVIFICCTLIADTSYNKLKNDPMVWLDVKNFINEEIEDKKEDFFKTMDKCYVTWHIKQLEDPNLENRLDGIQLLSMALELFTEKHSLTLRQ